MSQKKAAVKHDPLQAQRPFDADEVLSDVERELPVLLRSLIAALWYILAAALSASAVAYIAIRTITAFSPSFAIGVVVFAFMLPLLFLGEGSEVAVAMLIDKDPEQFGHPVRLWFERLWRCRDQDPPPFIIGRQLIVVMAVVLLTFLSGKLVEIPDVASTAFATAGGRFHGYLVQIASTLRTSWVQYAFALLFPTFIALWIAQLPSKLIAHRDPLRLYSWFLTRVVVRGALVIGSRLEVERLSVGLARWLLRQGDPPEKLRPGRPQYFETSALLRGGRALKRATIDITILKDGAVKVRESFEYYTFAAGLKQIPQRVYWEKPYAQYAPVKFTKWPENIGIRPSVQGKPSATPEVRHGKSLYPLEWNVELPHAVPAGSELGLELNFQTAPGAMATIPTTADYFYYNVYQVPTAELIVHIAPAADAPFMLLERAVIAEASEDEDVNVREAKLVEVDAKADGGLRFRVRYPLLNTRFVFNWVVERRSATTVPLLVAASAAGDDSHSFKS